MTTLEQRLRDELERTAPGPVPPAPGIEVMHATVSRRRRRNRALMGLGSLAAVVAVAGAIAVSRPDSSSDVIASAPEAATDAQSNSAVDDPASDGDADGSIGTNGEPATVDAGSGTPPADGAVEPANGSLDRKLQASPVTPTIETRRSAVEFAGGSGVFVVPTADGYFGLASRFGGDRGVGMIGMESANGLDWTEVGLGGVPAGATVTLLRDFGTSYFAVFSQYDEVNQRNVTRISSSPDLRSWTGGVALPGDDTIVADLAAGRGGLMVVGVAPAPTVWLGPPAGPYEEVGRIDQADNVTGVVALGEGFVVAGTSDGTPMLFESLDGESWTMSPVGAAAEDETVVEIAVSGPVISVAGDGQNGAWTASSLDGGETWQRSDIGSMTVDNAAMRGTSLSLLGTSPLGVPEITLADDETWVTAELDIAAGDRVKLLVAGSDTLLLTADESGLTWVVASR